MFHSIIASMSEGSAYEAQKKTTITHPRDASTRESYASHKQKSQCVCSGSLWRIMGTTEQDCEEIVGETEIVVERDSIKVECPKTDKCHKYKIMEIEGMQRHVSDCVQWIYHHEEFGILFSNAGEAGKFCRAYCGELGDHCETVYKTGSCRLVECEKGEYKCVEEEVCASVCRTPHEGSEQYIFVKTSDKELVGVCRLDQETSVEIDESRCVVSWWPGLSLTKSFERPVTGVCFKTKQECREFWEECEPMVRNKPSGMNQSYCSVVSENTCLEFMDVEMSQKTCGPEEVRHETLTISGNRCFAAKTDKGKESSKLQCYSINTKGHCSKQETREPDMGARPSCLVMQTQGKEMIYNDQIQRHQLSVMDVAQGTVVRTWKDEIPTAGLCSYNKLSDSVCLGYNEQSIFAIDTREKNPRQQTLTYSTNPKFTCAATTQQGEIATGNAQGTVRLYDGNYNQNNQIKRAKTQIQIGSFPIVSITTTKAGDWVLATCARYLALIPVKVPETQYTAFKKTLCKERPQPIILKLDIQDILKCQLQDVKFNKAVFDAQETTIIAASGPYIFMWNFSEIQRGVTPSYTIKKAAHTVNQVEHYKSGPVESLVFATPSQVETDSIKRVHKK